MRRSAASSARQMALNQKRLQREREQQAKLDAWCEQHDDDGNGEFDRNELRSLLNALYPDHEVEEEQLDQLMERATGVYTANLTLKGDKNGRVTKKLLLKTVAQYEGCEPPLVVGPTSYPSASSTYAPAPSQLSLRAPEPLPLRVADIKDQKRLNALFLAL